MSSFSAGSRDAVIVAICNGFVAPSKANKAIYRYILETLWPSGSGLPGPVVGRDELRAGVNQARRRAGATDDYLDVFRRLRELQGEEGLLGLQKVGSSYQLVHAEVAPKRIPRKHIPDATWAEVLSKSSNACRVCREPAGSSGPSTLVPDHRVPRSRLNEAAYSTVSVDSASNLQPLCQNCNTHKSVSCRGCQADCYSCPWAFPESNPLVTLRGELLQTLAHLADKQGTTVQVFVEDLLKRYLEDGQSAQ